MAQSTEPNAGEGGAGAPPAPQESNKAPDLTRQYRAEGITVLWYAKRCIHAAECIRNAPRVFDPRRRPWIDLSGTDQETIKRAVLACPTGALEYLADDDTGEPVEATTIELHPGGPYLLRGRIEVRDEAGNTIRRASRVALCRCGKTANPPFCDNSHRAVHPS